MNLHDRILITGANGLVGKALSDLLLCSGYTNVILLTRAECELTDFNAVKTFFENAKPTYVFHLAAAVYGLGGNLKYRGKIFLDNILMNTHVIEACHLNQVKKVIAMGTIATYPASDKEPIQEDYIWDGPPHASESSYGHAKRAMLAQLLAYQENYNLDFAYVLSTNLYGPYDKFNADTGHVIPSLIRKFYEAKKANASVTVWGDGSAARDFMYSKDMALALVQIAKKFSGSINIGTGIETPIELVVNLLANYLGMQEKVFWDPAMPNGRKYQPLDLTRLQSIDFKSQYSIETGLIETYDWFTEYSSKSPISNHSKECT